VKRQFLSRCFMVAVCSTLTIACASHQERTAAVDQMRQDYIKSHPDLGGEKQSAMTKGIVLTGMNVKEVQLCLAGIRFPSYARHLYVEPPKGSSVAYIWVPDSNTADSSPMGVMKMFMEIERYNGIQNLTVYDGPWQRYIIVFREGKVIAVKQLINGEAKEYRSSEGQNVNF
jgi:hypothetical protein